MRVVVAVAVLLLFPAAARADYTVATVERPTTVSAYAGHVVWSQFDGSSYRLYEAHASPAGQVTTQLAAAPRSVPFDADIGPGADGTPTVVYSRCATEPKLDQLPIWATARGCDVYRLALGATKETRVAGVSTAADSEFLPSIWRGRIAFARVYDRNPYVYVRGPEGPNERQPGGMRGETGLPGPTSLDLAGVRLALTWGVDGDARTEVRLDTTTGGHRLLEFTTDQGRGERVVNAFVFAGRVWWAHETDTGPLHRYRRWRIATEKLEEADIPNDRQPTLSIAPQSASSVYWSQPGRVGGDGSAIFQASL
ncbi:hypothetical protein [Solirubrobacter soli]|uniref:hypothetical protein n=1 Tax=Solirubrobacter soli TaxID=363832 RepID=UPI00040AAA47|nr:hypothetical protein [Solirubrobacter soli]